MKLVCLLLAFLGAQVCCSARNTRFDAARQLLPPIVFAKHSNDSHWNVLDFGAVGDGKTDNTQAFQAALNAAGNANGGVVVVPDGQFLFKSALNIPQAVYLQGTYKIVPSHARKQLPPTTGSILMPTGSRGNGNGYWLTVSSDAAVMGFVIWYPDQVQKAAPVAYPWTVRLAGDNSAVTDIECLNCWNAIYAVAAARHYIARVQGQPINTGVYIDETYDIGRVEDVHFNPWYSAHPDFMRHQLTQGRAFVMARTDWEYMFNCFAFGYAIGYHFIKSAKGSCNGNFLGIGADLAVNASVQVDAADPWGILITNGEFTSFEGNWIKDNADHTQIVVTAQNEGAVRLENTAFWGPSHANVRVSGGGSVALTDCIFNYWDAANKGRYSIECRNYTGDLTVSGNDFQHDGNQVDLGSGVLRAVVTSNMMAGSKRIKGSAAHQAIGMNAAGGPPKPPQPMGRRFTSSPQHKKLREEVLLAIGKLKLSGPSSQ